MAFETYEIRKMDYFWGYENIIKVLRKLQYTYSLIVAITFFSFTGFAQNIENNSTNEVMSTNPTYQDSISSQTEVNDSLMNDSLQPEEGPRKDFIDARIQYDATDTVISKFIDGKEKVFMYNNAVIKYMDLELTAGYIELTVATKEVYASGFEDSTGTVVQKPHFKQGNEEFDSEEIRYNFDTGKGFTNNIITEQQEGFVHSSIAKMTDDGVYCLQDGKFTTCDHEHPHFYIDISKAKMVNGKSVVSGPAHVVIEDVHIRFPFLPFGYFPFTSSYSSGILLPSYGQESTRGYYLKDAGFYWAASDYFDAQVTGDIYSRGSWAMRLKSTYKLRYKFSGNISLNYSKTITGEKGVDQSDPQTNYSIGWTHRQDAKSNPNQTFSVSFDFSSSGYDRTDNYQNNNYLNNSKSSSISYTRKFPNTPLSFSSNMRIAQNTADSTLTVAVPELTFNMSRIYPFKRENRVGKARFYEDIGLTYSANLTNKITTHEDELLPLELSNWQNGVKHNISLPLPSFNLLKYIIVSPSYNYNERWYFDYLDKYWIDGHKTIDQETGEEIWVEGKVVEEEISQFKRNYDYSFSLSSNTTFYGTYTMKNTDGKIEAIRHKVNPSVGISYKPDFGDPRFGFYDWVQTDSLGTMKQYDRFDDGVYGSASQGESASLSFSLSQNVEMKTRNFADTVSNDQNNKIPLIDELRFSGSYNFIADSMKLSQNIPWIIRTKIKNMNFQVSGNLNPYNYIYENGSYKNIDQLRWKTESGFKRLGRITSASTGLSYSFKSGSGKDKDGEKGGKGGDGKPGPPGESSKGGNAQEDQLEELYMPWAPEWSLSFNYSFNYSKPFDEPTISQTLSLNGNLKLTEKWGTSFSSNFDFESMQFQSTTINVTRDLHCWTMLFGFSPFGENKYYNFTLNVNSNLLKDLKITKKHYAQYDDF